MTSDAYLTLAESVLDASRCPLSAKEIIERAFILNLVPKHLHGRTQHKTLTARISEDILKNRERSIFFRPYPGRYFLNKFIRDSSLPIEYRRPIIARRRARQLRKEYAAYIPFNFPVPTDKFGCFTKAQFARLVRGNEISYDREGRPGDRGVPVWHLSCVRRDNEVLSYRRGRYLDGREGVVEGKTIGFSAPLTHNDRSLFEQMYHGVLGAAVSTVAIDLNLEHSSAFQEIEERSAFKGGFYDDSADRRFVVLVCEIWLPSGFTVESKRLAIKDLEWVEAREFRRRIYNYDQWSQRSAFLLK